MMDCKGKGSPQTQAVWKSQLGKLLWVSRPQDNSLWLRAPRSGGVGGPLGPRCHPAPRPRSHPSLSWRVARIRSQGAPCFLSVELGEDDSLLLFCPPVSLPVPVDGVSVGMTSPHTIRSPMDTSSIPSIRQQAPSQVLAG